MHILFRHSLADNKVLSHFVAQVLDEHVSNLLKILHFLVKSRAEPFVLSFRFVLLNKAKTFFISCVLREGCLPLHFIPLLKLFSKSVQLRLLTLVLKLKLLNFDLLTLKTLSVLLSLRDERLVINLQTLQHLPQFNNLFFKVYVVLPVLFQYIAFIF